MKTRLIALAVILLAGCAAEPTVLPPDAFATPTTQSLPTVVQPTAEPLPTPTLVPTEVPRSFVVYRQRTGVVSLTLPEGWEALDDSTDQRIRVRVLPPVGYGSRVTVEVVNEGPQQPDGVAALIESYIRLNYGEQPGYTEVSRRTLDNGDFEAVFAYDDGVGATGQERLIIRQAGPYFAAMRLFLADDDVFALTNTLDTIAGSLAVDTQIAWGTRVAAINPAELAVVNSLLWRDTDGVTYYMGEVRNNAPSAIQDVAVTVALCNQDEVVLNEITQPTAISVIRQGSTMPFAVVVEGLPEDVQLCSQSVTAAPARPDPSRTTGLALDSRVDTAAGIALLVEGTVTNAGLSPVTDIRILVGVYDEAGAVVGYAVVELGRETVLEPGQSAEFRTVLEETGGPGARYVIQAEGTVLRSINPSLNP